MKELQFGKITKIENKGHATVSTETTFVDSVPTIKYKYERRIFVRNQKEELAEYLKFSDSVHQYKNAIDDISFLIETSNRASAKGGYYVVECWTELDNFKRIL